ncbi:MAG TPA: ADP-ribosylglycohydrolase family protein [Gemmatimonadales bacterium]|jgi:hypothetical protein
MSRPDDDAATAVRSRREGLLVGAAVGAALAAGSPPPPERSRAPIALADALLGELVGGGVDLRRMSRSWVTWYRSDGLDADPILAMALQHLEEFDAPTDQLPQPSAIAIAAALPAALAAASPRAMVSGTFHVARMLDPRPTTGLVATAIVVAAAALIDGQRDVLPEAVTFLRANDAPAPLVEQFRAVARDRHIPPPSPRGPHPDPATVATWVLGELDRHSRSVDLLHNLVDAGVSSTAGAILGALAGARDGVASWPDRWLQGGGDDVSRRQKMASRLG